MRHIPTVAVPVKAADLRAGWNALLRPAEAEAGYCRRLRECSASPFCSLVSSGRAALALILLALKQNSSRRQVILPAYTCSTVVLSVQAAGLEPVFCDISPQTLGMETGAVARLIGPDTLAILPTYLYGLALDIRSLLELGRQAGAFVVEDAAQAMGASFDGRWLGTLGDAGLFSLGRGKSTPAGHGGVILAKKPLIPALEAVLAQKLSARPARGWIDLPLLVGYGLATNPTGWWLISRSPYNPAIERSHAALPSLDFERMRSAQVGISLSLLQRLDEINAARRAKARQLSERLVCFSWASIPAEPPEGRSIYLRLPVMIDHPERADRLFAALHQRGIGVSRSYTWTLPGRFPTPAAKDGSFPGAEAAATRLLTLPTNPYLTEEGLDLIEAAFSQVDA